MSDALPSPSPQKERSFGQAVRLPKLSGKVSAFWLVVCLALTALLIPMALRLPVWIEAEVVLGVWWAIWFGVLTRLLFIGWRVTDDHALPPPRNWLSGWGGEQAKGTADGCATGWWVMPFELEGCAWILIALCAFVLLFFVAWFVIEVAVPLILFLLYFVTRGMLAKVINDPHYCQGHVPRALGWAALWATLYTAPLALAVWAVHVLHERAKMGG